MSIPSVSNLLKQIFLLSVAFTISGCVNNGHLAFEWSKMIREEQIQPVFPPREDIRPGDIFLTSFDPNAEITRKSTGFLPVGIFIDSLDTSAMLKERYLSRPRHRSVNTNLVQQEFSNGPVPNNLSEITDGYDLRDVTFPDFSYALTREANLEAIFPIDGLSTKIGIDSSSVKSLDMKIGDSVSQTLPAAAIHKNFLNQWELEPYTSKDSNAVQNLSGLRIGNESFAALMRVFTQGQTNKLLWVTVVTEVFYANSLDIKITSNKRIKPTVAVKPELLSINAGGSVSIVGASENQIGIRKTFNHPHAIGTRGLVYTIKEVNGSMCVMNIHTESGIVPKHAEHMTK